MKRGDLRIGQPLALVARSGTCGAMLRAPPDAGKTKSGVKGPRLKWYRQDTPEGVAENQAFLAAASSFFQVRLGALVTRPFFKAEAATRR